MEPNVLYYGDNLDVLRRHVKDESVDLIYLDPPFNSNATYNVLFAEKSGAQAAAQIKAFEDTWHWDEAAARAMQEVIEAGGAPAQAMLAFTTLTGPSDMLAYLAMMAPRLVELRRVLKSTGSIYLHCDPTASHYLKIILDAIFGPRNFRSDITWKRTNVHNDSKDWSAVADTLLYYVKDDRAAFTWNPVRLAYTPEYLASKYTHKEPNGRVFRLSDMRSPNPRPNLTYDWKGFKPHANGWAYSRSTMERLDAEGRIWYPEDKSKRPYLKRYLDEMPGTVATNVWTDIDPINSQARERLGYPTQKPEALLDRIIQASSDEGGLVLDPFCGCGTAIASAQRLNRRWIGIDITHLAIGLIRHRLHDAYGDSVIYKVVGEPTTVADAEELARSDPYQFQWWALGLVGARRAEEKKGADQGIDGRLYFHDEPVGGKTKQIVISVKAGHLTPSYVRDLRGVLDRESAQIGVLLSFEEPTKPMRSEAADAGFYKSPWGNHARIQLLTIGELLDGRKIDMPPPSQTNATFKKAEKRVESVGENLELPIDGAPAARPAEDE